MVEGDCQFRFLLLFVARLSFGHVPKNFGVFRDNDGASSVAQVLCHPGHDFIAGFYFFRVDALGELHGNDASGREPRSGAGGGGGCVAWICSR